jgi:polysaccharide export outer membrane protein
VGYLHVAQKSTEEIHTLLTRRLSLYVPRPQVFVRVADFRSKKIYVMGEVLKAGFIPLNDQPLSITNALNMTGSLDPNSSDPRHIYVIRGNFLRPEIYWLNASMPTALLLGEQFQLQDNDVLVVSTATVTRWNRFLNQLLPSLQTVWYTKAVTGK